MTISHSVAARDSQADNIGSLVDAGSADASGDMQLKENALLICELVLPLPAFGSSSGGTIILNGAPISNAAVDSTVGPGVNVFEVRDRDNGIVYQGTVTSTGGGGDLEMDNTSVNSGQTVTLQSHSYDAAP